MEIGKNIKEIREANKMTQFELAETLKLSVHTISKYEQGQRQPKIDQLKKIAEALGVSLDELLGIKENDTIGTRMAVSRNLDISPYFLEGKTEESDNDLATLDIILKEIEFEKIKSAIKPLSDEMQKELCQHISNYLSIISELTYHNANNLTIDVITLYSDIIQQVSVLRDELHFNMLSQKQDINNVLKLSDLKKETLINISSLLDKLQILYTQHFKEGE